MPSVTPAFAFFCLKYRIRSNVRSVSFSFATTSFTTHSNQTSLSRLQICPATYVIKSPAGPNCLCDNIALLRICSAYAFFISSIVGYTYNTAFVNSFNVPSPRFPFHIRFPFLRPFSHRPFLICFFSRPKANPFCHKFPFLQANPPIFLS